MRGMMQLSFYDQMGRHFRFTWFHMPYIQKMIHRGETYVFYGELIDQYGALSMTQPSFYPYEEYMQKMAGIPYPFYPLTRGLTQETLRKLMYQALLSMGEENPVPNLFYERYGLLSHEDAMWQIHFPEKEENVEAARRTLAFEEFFELLYEVRMRNKKDAVNTHVIRNRDIRMKAEKILPYELTASQIKCSYPGR